MGSSTSLLNRHSSVGRWNLSTRLRSIACLVASAAHCRDKSGRFGACPPCCSTGNSRRLGRVWQRWLAAPRSDSLSASPGSTAVLTTQPPPPPLSAAAVSARLPSNPKHSRERVHEHRPCPAGCYARLAALAAAWLTRAQP